MSEQIRIDGDGRSLMIKRILVPLDGSTAAEAVLPFVTEIGSATKAEVLLVSAVTPLAVWDEANATVKWEAEEATAGDYIIAKQKELAGNGLNVRSRVIFGPAPKVILAAAAEESAELIAMTTHGRSGIVRWILGSVADRVVHESEIPVLLVRPSETGLPTNRPIINKVLVPLDGSDLSLSALPLAEEIAGLLEASLVLFHAVTPPVTTFPGPEVAHMDQRGWEVALEGARAFLRTTADGIAARGHSTDEVVSLAPSVEGILDAAEHQSAGLIVMSTHGRSGVGRWIMGSVADAVARRSPVPVLVMRPSLAAIKA